MATKSKNLQAVYVELDVLLDTRLGTLARMSQEMADRILMEGGYHARKADVFADVDMEEFRKLYMARDVLTLQHSTLTGAISMVKRLVDVLADQAIERPYHDGAKIVVNYYPYQLTGEEKDELVRVIQAWIDSTATTTVELVSIATKDLTPRHCKSSYAMMMIYDHETWMNTHAAAFEQHRLPEVTMFSPAIYVTVPTAEELEKTVQEAAEPFEALKMLASPIIHLNFIDVKFFSILQK